MACAWVVVGTGCGDVSRLGSEAGFGPNPVLPAPRVSVLPTVHIAPAVGWAPGEAPHPAPGMAVVAFARGLDHPRWLLALPNGDVLVAESNAPARPGSQTGLRAWVTGVMMRKAGAATPSADRITLLRDTDGDGVADLRIALLEGVNSPFGMALIGPHLYVAASDAVLRLPFKPGDVRVAQPPTRWLALPAGDINHHWTKNLLASPDGEVLYVSVGSNSNVGERGVQAEVDRAAIWRVETRDGSHRLLATGLRNPNGMAWGPPMAASPAASVPAAAPLWTVVNERDELGSDLVPDYLTHVQDGGFYGWPYSYYGQRVDARPHPPRPDLVARAITPDYALGAHTASLGLAWSGGNTLPPLFAHGMFIGQHGSWNREPRSGYKVIFVPFVGAQPSGLPVDVLTGFIDEHGQARGRPVGVALDHRGALLVADDVGNTVWRVTATAATAATTSR